MAILPVTELVTENSGDLVGLIALDEGVIKDDVLLPGETEKISVGVGAALAAVDNVEITQGELEAGGEVVDLCLELSLGQRGQLVEEGQDEGRVGGGHEELETSGEGPEVEEELVASGLDDLEEAGDDRWEQGDGEQVGLDHVGDEELGSLLVEAELLFEDKGVVDARGEVKDLLQCEEAEDEDNGVADLAGEARRGRPAGTGHR
jgi:hypothetical protein